MITINKDKDNIKINIGENCTYEEYYLEMSKSNLECFMKYLYPLNMKQDEFIASQEIRIYILEDCKYIIVKDGVNITISSIKETLDQFQKVIIATTENNAFLKIGYISKNSQGDIESETYPYVIGYDLLDKNIARDLAMQMLKEIDNLNIDDSLDFDNIINKINLMTKKNYNNVPKRVLK